MNQFFDRVRRKALDASEPPVIIVAFGDSVTQGAMEKDRLDPAGVYHRLLQEKLEAFYPATIFSTINAGVGGNTATQALVRLERDVLRHQPDLVLVAFGLNDCLEGKSGLIPFQAAIREIVTSVNQRTIAELILVTPPFMAQRANLRVHPEHAAFMQRIIQAQADGTLAAYAATLRDIAKETGALLADIHSEWERLSQSGIATDDWLSNGLNHPDRRGHALAATVLFSVLINSH